MILWVQLALGMWTVYTATDHLDGSMFVRLVEYVQGIVIFRSGNADLLIGVPWVYRAHIALGLTIFLIFPFTRMVHIWSGFATVYYLLRPAQIVRTRRARVLQPGWIGGDRKMTMAIDEVSINGVPIAADATGDVRAAAVHELLRQARWRKDCWRTMPAKRDRRCDRSPARTAK